MLQQALAKHKLLAGFLQFTICRMFVDEFMNIRHTRGDFYKSDFYSHITQHLFLYFQL